jgi:hypothetical protein
MDMASAKVSITIPRADLAAARLAAAREGLSLSAFFSRAVRSELEEHQRREAARRLIATFDPAGSPSLERQQELLALWNRRTTTKPKQRKRRAAPGRSTRS